MLNYILYMHMQYALRNYAMSMVDGRINFP